MLTLNEYLTVALWGWLGGGSLMIVIYLMALLLQWIMPDSGYTYKIRCRFDDDEFKKQMEKAKISAGDLNESCIRRI